MREHPDQNKNPRGVAADIRHRHKAVAETERPVVDFILNSVSAFVRRNSRTRNRTPVVVGSRQIDGFVNRIVMVAQKAAVF